MKKALKYIKNNIVHMDKLLLFFSIVLAIVGLFSIVSASTRESVITYNLTLYHYFEQHLIMLSIACLGGFIIINVPTKNYKWIAPLLYIVVLGLIIATFFIGDDVGRGNNNWLPIGSFKFQPSELAKPVIIVMTSILFSALYKPLRNINNNKRGRGILVIIITIGLIPFAVYKLQGDLGTTLIILAIVGVLLLASPLLRNDKLLIFGIGGITALLWIGGSLLFGGSGLSSSQTERFSEFWDPCNNYTDNGYQVCNAIIAINNGGLQGRGPGKSQQKYSYIPDPHTDMIFSIIAEERGVLGCTIIFILMFYIINKILILANVANTISNKYICLGVATYMMAHIFVNLGGLFAVIPLTGVPLPFLSYGGTFTISFICSLAIVQRIHIESKIEYEKKKANA